MAHSVEHLYIFGEVFVKVFVPFLNCFVCISSLSIPYIYFVLDGMMLGFVSSHLWVIVQ